MVLVLVIVIVIVIVVIMIIMKVPDTMSRQSNGKQI